MNQFAPRSLRCGVVLFLIVGMTTLIGQSPSSALTGVANYSYLSVSTPPALLSDVVDMVAVQCFSVGNCEALANVKSPNSPLTGIVALAYAEKNGVWGPGDILSIPSQTVTLNSLSCASAGNCAAVGDTLLGSGAGQVQSPVAFSETSGNWNAGVSPALDSPATDPHGELLSVSCPSAGNCVAVGDYERSPSDQVAIAVDLSNDAWGPAAVVGPSAGSRTALVAVSCPSAGNCVATGFTRQLEALVLTLTQGNWSNVAVGTIYESLESVHCVTVGNCTAVGSGPLVVSERQGTWSQTQLSVNGSLQFVSLSCPAIGYCAAVGYMGGYPQQSPVRAQERNSVWTVVATPLSSLPTNHEAYFTAVSCGAVDSCVATGVLQETSHFTTQAFVDTDVAGTWKSLTSTSTAFTSSLRNQSLVRYASVSCPARNRCALAGTAASLHGSGSSGVIAQTFSAVLAVPSAPTIIGLKVMSASAVFHVVAPPAPVAPLQSLQVLVGPANSRWTTLSVTTRVVNLLSLKAHTRYTIHVRYLNAAGAGAGWKKTITTT